MKNSAASLPPDSAGSLMTVAMVAKRLHHSASTVYGLIESGKLAHYRCPGIRISEAQLKAFLEGAYGPVQPPQTKAAKPARSKLRHISL